MSLRLGENQLTSVPPELGNLTALKALNLDGNPRLKRVPKELGKLKNVNLPPNTARLIRQAKDDFEEFCAARENMDRHLREKSTVQRAALRARLENKREGKQVSYLKTIKALTVDCGHLAVERAIETSRDAAKVALDSGIQAIDEAAASLLLRHVREMEEGEEEEEEEDGKEERRRKNAAATVAKNAYEQRVGAFISRIDAIARGHREKLEQRMRAAEKAKEGEVAAAAAEAMKTHKQKMKEVKSRLMSHIHPAQQQNASAPSTNDLLADEFTPEKERAMVKEVVESLSQISRDVRSEVLRAAAAPPPPPRPPGEMMEDEQAHLLLAESVRHLTRSRLAGMAEAIDAAAKGAVDMIDAELEKRRRRSAAAAPPPPPPRPPTTTRDSNQRGV